MPLGTGGPAQRHRRDWVVAARKDPTCPCSSVPEENAEKLLLLFWPWTSNVEDATDEVPYIGDLRPRHMSSWREALSARIARHGERYATNYAFVYCLPPSTSWKTTWQTTATTTSRRTSCRAWNRKIWRRPSPRASREATRQRPATTSRRTGKRTKRAPSTDSPRRCPTSPRTSGATAPRKAGSQALRKTPGRCT